MKSVASLSAALLARKGAASPADHLEGAGDSRSADAGAHLESNNHTVTHRRFAGREPKPGSFGVRGTKAGSAAPDEVRDDPEKVTDEKRIALTLRLDRKRHLGLKLLSAHLDQSGQQLMIGLLDDLLARHAGVFGGCACLQGIASECVGGGNCAK